MLIDYYIVASSSFYGDKLKYRRHRLVDRLLKKSSTRKIYWVHAINDFTKSKSILKNRLIVNEINGKLVEIGLVDFKNFLSYQSRFNKSIVDIVNDGKKNKVKNVLWYTCPAFSGLSDYNIWDRVVYDCSDSWGNPWGKLKGIRKLETIRNSMIKNSEKRVAKNSEVLFSTSNFLGEKIKRISDKDVMVIENGVDYLKFDVDASERLFEIPSPRVGFVGGLKNKIDFEVLYKLATKMPDYNIVLVGPNFAKDSNEFNTLVELPNVYNIGPVDYDEVPYYIQALDIGVLPYKKIEYNKAVSPLKLFEYLATGIPVVGYGVPTTEKYNEEGVYYYTYTHEEFIDACIKSSNQKSTENLVYRRKELAKENDWENKLNTMIDTVLEKLK